MATAVQPSYMKENHAARLAGRICLYALCLITAFLVIFPLLVLVITITHSDAEIQAGFTFTFGSSLGDNFKGLIDELEGKGISLFRPFLNSVFISLTSTGLCIYFSALTAYACHVYDFKGKKFFEKFILFLIIIPGQLGAVGFFRLMLDLNFYDTYVPFILPAIAAPSTVYFLRQYLKSNFSKEYVDAARMDGASEFRIFNMICLPYIKAALATMALFGIISSWNNFMGPMTFLQSHELFTLPRVMNELLTMQDKDYGIIYLGSFVITLPMLIVYLFMSKIIMKGVSAGGLKS